MRREYNEPVNLSVRVSFGSISATYCLENYIKRTGRKGETVFKHYGKVIIDEGSLKTCECLDDFIKLFSHHRIFWREDESGCKMEECIESKLLASEENAAYTEEITYGTALYQKEKISQEIFLRRIGIYRKYYSPQSITIDVEYCDNEEKRNHGCGILQQKLGPVQLEMSLGA